MLCYFYLIVYLNNKCCLSIYLIAGVKPLIFQLGGRSSATNELQVSIITKNYSNLIRNKSNICHSWKNDVALCLEEASVDDRRRNE